MKKIKITEQQSLSLKRSLKESDDFYKSNYLEITPDGFEKFIELLESSIELMDYADWQYYSDETALPIETLVDYYSAYGWDLYGKRKAEFKENIENMKRKFKLVQSKSNQINESLIDETYFPTYTAALNKVRDEIEEKGYQFNPNFFIPAKPKVGQTVRLNIKLYYGEDESENHVHISVYNNDNEKRTNPRPYELVYHFSNTNEEHRKLNKIQFTNLIKFLDLALTPSTLQHFSEKTNLPENILRDYHMYYGQNEERINELIDSQKMF